MVRNIPSYQSLRSAGSHERTGADNSIQPDRVPIASSSSSAIETRSQTTEPELVTLVARPQIRVSGDDDRSKQLLAKIATGTATAQEQEELRRHVANFMHQRPGPTKFAMHRDTVRTKWNNASFREQGNKAKAEEYIKPFCDFMTENPTIYHAVGASKQQLLENGWKEIDERDAWKLEKGGKYVLTRNGAGLIAFVVGDKYEPGNGAAIIAGHIDSLTAKLKPVSKVPDTAGYVQLGVAPYAGAMSSTWWDRDLGVAGRVLVKDGNKVVPKLTKLDWPIARIPTLAPHYGVASNGPFNPETRTTPIIGLSEPSHISAVRHDDGFSKASILGGDGPVNSFAETQPDRLVRAITKQIGIKSAEDIVGWELELFDFQSATVGGIDKEFIFAGRIDDKVCSWAAVQALIESDADDEDSSIIKVVGLFDYEEVGSLSRQGAYGNFLNITLERVVGALSDHKPTSDLLGRTYANSFLVSSDVIHAVNPNFLDVALPNHAPHLNVGMVVSADPNAHFTTDAVSTAIFKATSDKAGAKLQVFQIRNDSRSGGTIGPMLSAHTGIRAIDAGVPQLSMHSIRATTGSLDPGLGVITYKAFLDHFEEVDKSFRK